MENSPPTYQGKPVVYLDQNVLDWHVKEIDQEFFLRLTTMYQVVYSDETLREIKRSGEYWKSFVDTLECLQAMHFKFQITDSFQATDQILVSAVSPHKAYEDFCKIEPVYDLILSATQQTTLKFFGGRVGSDFEQINSEQLNAFKALMAHISETLALLPETEHVLRQGVEDYQLLLTHQYEQALEQSTQQLRKHITNEGSWSGVRDYRDHTGTGPKELNNISPPNVIEKIWQAHQDLEGYDAFTIEGFLGITNSPIYGRQMYVREKIISIYNLLNVVGYHQDSRLARESRQQASISDAAHASIAATANLLLSRDEAFVTKVRAIYEYLAIDTQVGFLTVINGNISIAYD